MTSDWPFFFAFFYAVIMVSLGKECRGRHAGAPCILHRTVPCRGEWDRSVFPNADNALRREASFHQCTTTLYGFGLFVWTDTSPAFTVTVYVAATLPFTSGTFTVISPSSGLNTCSSRPSV